MTVILSGARRRWVPSLLLCPVLGGCGAGASQANEPAASLNLSTSASAQASGSAAKPSWAELKPCELLSPSDRSTAGLTTIGEGKAIGAARACDWTVPGVVGVSITLDGAAGLSDLKVAKTTVTTTKVGGHKALQVSDKKAADGTCAVLLGVGDSASAQVDVSNSNFADTALACQRARTVAQLIEPKLP
jgi:hypothetical protein